MNRIAALLLALLLCGCSPEHVSPDEFKKQYDSIGSTETQTVTFIGQRGSVNCDGRAIIRINSKSPDTGKWSERSIYVELAELEPAFRESLPAGKVTRRNQLPRRKDK